MEQYLGDDIRREYPYLKSWLLHGVLTRRRRPVLLDHRVVRTWLEKYAPRRIIEKRKAAVVWGTAGDSSAKRATVSGPLVPLSGASALEDACGERYRREVSDLGLGYRLSPLSPGKSKYTCILFPMPFTIKQFLFILKKNLTNKTICFHF